MIPPATSGPAAPRSALLFAYGTLRDPGRLRSLVGDACVWRYAGEASVQGRLYDAGAYPVLVPSPEAGDRVPGVLIELVPGEKALARLDAYEGVGTGLYRRRLLPVQTPTGTVEAWVYVYQRSVRALRRIRCWPPA